MSKVIYISGAHGTGKSTILEHLKNLKIDRVIVDEFKVARAVMSQFGYKGSSDYQNDPIELMKFQDAVIQQKKEHDYGLLKKNDNNIYLVERSFSDILAYTELFKTEIEKTTYDYSMIQWFADYRLRCTAYQTEIYDYGIFILSGLFKLVDDGVRPQGCQHEIEHLIYDHALACVGTNNFKILRDADINHRIAKITDMLEDIKQYGID